MSEANGCLSTRTSTELNPPAVSSQRLLSDNKGCFNEADMSPVSPRESPTPVSSSSTRKRDAAPPPPQEPPRSARSPSNSSSSRYRRDHRRHDGHGRHHSRSNGDSHRGRPRSRSRHRRDGSADGSSKRSKRERKDRPRREAEEEEGVKQAATNGKQQHSRREKDSKTERSKKSMVQEDGRRGKRSQEREREDLEVDKRTTKRSRHRSGSRHSQSRSTPFSNESRSSPSVVMTTATTTTTTASALISPTPHPPNTSTRRSNTEESSSIVSNFASILLKPLPVEATSDTELEDLLPPGILSGELAKRSITRQQSSQPSHLPTQPQIASSSVQETKQPSTEVGSSKTEKGVVDEGEKRFDQLLMNLSEQVKGQRDSVETWGHKEIDFEDILTDEAAMGALRLAVTAPKTTTTRVLVGATWNKIVEKEEAEEEEVKSDEDVSGDATDRKADDPLSGDSCNLSSLLSTSLSRRFLDSDLLEELTESGISLPSSMQRPSGSLPSGRPLVQGVFEEVAWRKRLLATWTRS